MVKKLFPIYGNEDPVPYSTKHLLHISNHFLPQKKDNRMRKMLKDFKKKQRDEPIQVETVDTASQNDVNKDFGFGFTFNFPRVLYLQKVKPSKIFHLGDCQVWLLCLTPVFDILVRHKI